MKNSRTIQQVRTAKDRAERFLRNVLHDDDRADEVADESPEHYAERRHIELIENPARLSRAAAVRDMLDFMDHSHSRRNNTTMAQPTKQELNDLVTEAGDKITELLDPELTREEIVRKAKELDELINGSDEDDEDDDDEGDEGDEEDDE